MENLTLQQEERLCRLLRHLIDQDEARIIIRPNRNAFGYWFGGGSIVHDPSGTIWLSGRYRDYGDSRSGLEEGPRGLECTIFRSDDKGDTFQQVRSWSKADLSRDGRTVLSIEGTALHRMPDGKWELFISSEKESRYPEPFEDFQKPGTGVWSIDRMTGSTLEDLNVATVESCLRNDKIPEYLHIKDPVVYDDADGGATMIFCSHPFTWASSNTGLAVRPPGKEHFKVVQWEMVSRGPCWDVAATRITCRMPVPRLGCFEDAPDASIYFYDGAECMRPHEQSSVGQTRPRGYSCEEVGGAFFGYDGKPFSQLERLSSTQPLFSSPWGTGSSRYVDTLTTSEGILAIWQQSQKDRSQPLVAHHLSFDEIARILSTV
jgi:hypothetical protein